MPASALTVGAVVAAVAPDGRRFQLRFDGIQDFAPLPYGLQQQFTALEEIPGLAPDHSTTYADTIRRLGFTVEQSNL